MKVIIEHGEPVLSKWLWFEYYNCFKIIGRDNLIFTNVKRLEDYNKLKSIGEVYRESIIYLVKNGVFRFDEIIILDPKAPIPLSPADFKGSTKIVIGGILGDYPPRGRTSKFITSKLESCIARNLGPHQFSIDGSVYMALQVSLGKSLSQIPVALGFEIKVNDFHEIFLPYAFPVVNGRPLISRELIEYLKSSEIVEDELELIRSE